MKTVIFLKDDNTYTVYWLEETQEKSYTIKSGIKDPQTALMIKNAFEIGYINAKQKEE